MAFMNGILERAVGKESQKRQTQKYAHLLPFVSSTQEWDLGLFAPISYARFNKGFRQMHGRIKPRQRFLSQDHKALLELLLVEGAFQPAKSNPHVCVLQVNKNAYSLIQALYHSKSTNYKEKTYKMLEDLKQSRFEDTPILLWFEWDSTLRVALDPRYLLLCARSRLITPQENTIHGLLDQDLKKCVCVNRFVAPIRALICYMLAKKARVISNSWVFHSFAKSAEAIGLQDYYPPKDIKQIKSLFCLEDMRALLESTYKIRVRGDISNLVCARLC
ncbi:hypothetical protein [Helicobacter suis]|uniref:hypothetical protein n=1 Tax=Helicobacter suis TaxID=104628 RepID=UPI000CF0C613|nr:hypothetical protein [Helicobacter suis]